MIYELQRPIENVDVNTGAKVVVLERIDLRMPTAKDVKATKGLSLPIDLLYKHLVLLGGVPRELADRIHIDDLTVLDKITDAFFDAPAERAESLADAWLRKRGLAGLKPDGTKSASSTPATSGAAGEPSR